MKLGMLKICAHWRFLSEIWVFRFHRNAWNRRKSLKMCFPYVFLSCELGRMKKLGCTNNTCPYLFWSQICASIWEICNLRYSGCGYNQMGCNQMGCNQMGCNQMNYNQMNYNQMGADQMGYNQMGYNQMACNQMGCGQVWGSQHRTMTLPVKGNVFCFTRAQRHHSNGWQSKVAKKCKGVMNIKIPQL